MRTIAVMNQKGGVGKTTTAVNLSHGLALKGWRVLAVDLDPQGHMSTSLGAAPTAINLDTVLRGEAGIHSAAVEVRKGLDLVSPGARLNEVDGLSSGGAARGWLLRDALREVSGYDYLIIDCPPSSGLLGMNAILATKELLIPVSGDYLALAGLSRLMGIIKTLETRTARTTHNWILLTRFQKRRRHAREVERKIHSYFPQQLLRTRISEAVALTESPSFGKTIFEYKPNSASAAEYRDLTMDIINRQESAKAKR
ncbi:MAG: ParA family protein [Gammaproteobacteria bacterium]|nr:ParA family protein [Gammaproteobacteria bacterium]